jgi:hypothetical protein
MCVFACSGDTDEDDRSEDSDEPEGDDEPGEGDEGDDEPAPAAKAGSDADLMSSSDESVDIDNFHPNDKKCRQEYNRGLCSHHHHHHYHYHHHHLHHRHRHHFNHHAPADFRYMTVDNFDLSINALPPSEQDDGNAVANFINAWKLSKWAKLRNTKFGPLYSDAMLKSEVCMRVRKSIYIKKKARENRGKSKSAKAKSKSKKKTKGKRKLFKSKRDFFQSTDLPACPIEYRAVNGQAATTARAQLLLGIAQQAGGGEDQPTEDADTDEADPEAQLEDDNEQEDSKEQPEDSVPKRKTPGQDEAGSSPQKKKAKKTPAAKPKSQKVGVLVPPPPPSHFPSLLLFVCRVCLVLYTLFC